MAIVTEINMQYTEWDTRKETHTFLLWEAVEDVHVETFFIHLLSFLNVDFCTFVLTVRRYSRCLSLIRSTSNNQIFSSLDLLCALFNEGKTFNLSVYFLESWWKIFFVLLLLCKTGYQWLQIHVYFCLNMVQKPRKLFFHCGTFHFYHCTCSLGNNT